KNRNKQSANGFAQKHFHIHALHWKNPPSKNPNPRKMISPGWGKIALRNILSGYSIRVRE
ncbi:MAG TPA: hypothetical protein VNV85_01790, partial [Puia sp.]|nr:hypothetical protein [Puia sp.]